jgi:type IV pilus assembly protein PilM
MFERLRQPVSFKRSRPVAEGPFAAGAEELQAVPVGEPLESAAGEEIMPVLSAPAADDASAADATITTAKARAPRSRRAARTRRQGSRRESTLVGLAIEPGLIVAAKSHVNGTLVVDNAAYAQVDPDVVRDGEVNDTAALVEALTEMFKSSKLERRVRIGIANQRIMMRRIELPPLTDPTEIRQAVRFQAQDEIPMPIESVVLDYHSLGISEGPSGPRLQVLIVAARRDMVERVLQAARLAGLQPEGVDLAAFGMIRALRPADAGETEQILYLDVGGLTNLAISRGPVCEFTRVISWGVEQIAGDVASRCAMPLDAARQLLVNTPVTTVAGAQAPSVDPPSAIDDLPGFESPPLASDSPPPPSDSPTVPLRDPSDLLEGPPPPSIDQEKVASAALSEGIRRIASEVRHSLDFYLTAQGETPVTRAVLCGPALEIHAFSDALSRELGIPVARGEVALASPGAAGGVPSSVLPVAAGLSVPDGPA